MRDNEDQMSPGSAGRMRGQPANVRIPRRVVTRSLRTGVSPAMQQSHNGQGQFQGTLQGRPVTLPIRPIGPRRGGMFNRFMNRATGNAFQRHYTPAPPGTMDRIRERALHGMPHPHPAPTGTGHPGMNQGFRGHMMDWQQMQTPPWERMMNGGQGPFGGHQSDLWTHGINGQPGHGIGPFPGGDPNGPPIGVGPILGHGQTMNGMIQAIMDDLGGGVNANQFANMQAGNLPGGMHGDFLRALGGGDMNNSPLQALVQHLVQGADGNYKINGDQGAAISQILRQAIRNNPNFHPPKPPKGLFGNGGRPVFGNGGFLPGTIPGFPGQRYPLGIPQAGLPR